MKQKVLAILKTSRFARMRLNKAPMPPGHFLERMYPLLTLEKTPTKPTNATLLNFSKEWLDCSPPPTSSSSPGTSTSKWTRDSPRLNTNTCSRWEGTAPSCEPPVSSRTSNCP